MANNVRDKLAALLAPLGAHLAKDELARALDDMLQLGADYHNALGRNAPRPASRAQRDRTAEREQNALKMHRSTRLRHERTVENARAERAQLRAQMRATKR